MSRSFIVFALYLLAAFPMHGSNYTAQMPDFLIYEGDTLSIFSNPLEANYTEESRPENFFRGSHCGSTACWRGYIAFWTIEDDILYLTHIKSCCYWEDGVEADLTELFGEKYQNEKVKADWFTGEIIAPQGEMIQYQHMGYGSIYEFEKAFVIENGQLTNIKEYDNREYRYSEYQTNVTLQREFIFSNIDWDQLPKDKKETVRFYAFLTLDDNAQIDSVEVAMGDNEAYNAEIERVIKTIPEWTALYRHGELIKRGWMILVTIDKKTRKKYQKER